MAKKASENPYAKYGYKENNAFTSLVQEDREWKAAVKAQTDKIKP